MKNLLQLIIFLTFFNSYADNWVQKASVGGIQRNGAVGFSINSIGKGYVGTGGDGYGGFLNDFWAYDPLTDTWTQIANYLGAGREGLIAFSIDAKGYVGGGATSTTMAKDFWEYDPTTNNWIPKANLPAGARCYSFAFSIGKKGYMGAGWDSTYNPTSDFWEYYPKTNMWTQKANYGGGVTTRGVGISNGIKGYACMGYPSYNSNFWEYDPISNLWTQKANVGGPMRADVVGFSICAKIFIGTGGSLGAPGYTSQLWEYDPDSNKWYVKATFIGGPRDEAVGFSLMDKGYIGTGGFGLTDWYEYTPDSCKSSDGIVELLKKEEKIEIYPNPTKDNLTIETNLNTQQKIEISNLMRQTIYTYYIYNKVTINTSAWASGVYILRLNSVKETLVRKFVKE